MSRLPYDDEQDILNGLDSLEQDSEESEDFKSPEALKYFQNDQSALQPEGDSSLNGQVVGQSMRDPFQRLNQIVPPTREVAAEPIKVEDPINPQVTNYENILKQLQANRKDNNLTVNMARAGNQIAQAIASGYGSKIGDGSEALNAIERSNNQDISDFGDKIKLQMDDPASAISKYYRLQALKRIKEQDPNADLTVFDSMSANQLKQIVAPQLKGRGDLFFTTRFNPKTGKSEIVGVNRTTGEVQTSLGERSFGDKIIKDTETGKQQVYSQNTGVKELGSTPEELKNPAVNEAEVKKQQEMLNTPSSLKKVNPDLYKKFSKQQELFMKDVEQNREVATGATTLAKKLKTGAGNEIDSGLLGGIQTQAAKMAGQKGVLTDQDLVKFAGAGGVDAAIARIVNGTFFGQMSDQDVKFFKRFAEKMQEANAEDINNRSQLFIKNVHNEAKDYLPNLSEENVSKWLNVQSAAPASQQEMVKVISPKGIPGSVPKAKLKQAIEQGYKEVK